MKKSELRYTIGVLIISLFFIYQGITFRFLPDFSLNPIIQNFVMTVLAAQVAVWGLLLGIFGLIFTVLFFIEQKSKLNTTVNTDDAGIESTEITAETPVENGTMDTEKKRFTIRDYFKESKSESFGEFSSKMFWIYFVFCLILIL